MWANPGGLSACEKSSGSGVGLAIRTGWQTVAAGKSGQVWVRRDDGLRGEVLDGDCGVYVRRSGICAFPPNAWDPKFAAEFRDIPRIQSDQPPRLDPKSCQSKMLAELWRWNRAGRTDFDPGRLSQITGEPTVIDGPAVPSQPPQAPTVPPPPTPAPSLPEPPDPAPGKPTPPPYPPCLGDRCLHW